MTSALEQLTAAPVEARNLPESPLSVDEIVARRYHLDDLWLPTLVARRSALRHNLTRFDAWCEEQGVELAPHGKTSMSPQIWKQQLDSGSWGISAATAAQARVMDRFGVERVIVANQVADPDQALWLAQKNQAQDRCYYVLADSEAGVRLLGDASARAQSVLPVLIEYGIAGGRTGVRSREEALALGRAVVESPHLQLAGVQGYEGSLPQGRSPEAVRRAGAWLAEFTGVVLAMEEEGLFNGQEELLVTAGGSGFPDLAADALNNVSGTACPVRRVIRSGAYLTHDHLTYERRSPLRAEADDDPLIPALTCYARVNSVPESGLALLVAGKRDVPFDEDLPFVLRMRSPGSSWRQPEALEVTALNDHHLYIKDPGCTLAVGDVVELGLSHPCTTFDKWQVIPVLDEADHVVDALVTLF